MRKTDGKNSSEPPGTKRDRKLGDEWLGWQGEVEERGGDLATSPLMFLGLGGLALVLLVLGIGFFWYLTEPRLESWIPWAGIAAGWLLAAMGGATILWYTYLATTVLLGKGIRSLPLAPLAGGSLWPSVLWLGEHLGCSTDRLRNSALQVQNRLTLAWARQSLGPLLVLVPRCLSKTARADVEAVTAKYHVTFQVADGGTQARKLVAEQKPRAIVAVACERDLLSGMRDLRGRVPVLAVANKRPNGPCKATHLERDELEKAISFFMV